VFGVTGYINDDELTGTSSKTKVSVC